MVVRYSTFMGYRTSRPYLQSELDWKFFSRMRLSMIPHLWPGGFCVEEQRGFRGLGNGFWRECVAGWEDSSIVYGRRSSGEIRTSIGERMWR